MAFEYLSSARVLFKNKNFIKMTTRWIHSTDVVSLLPPPFTFLMLSNDFTELNESIWFIHIIVNS